MILCAKGSFQTLAAHVPYAFFHDHVRSSNEKMLHKANSMSEFHVVEVTVHRDMDNFYRVACRSTGLLRATYISNT